MLGQRRRRSLARILFFVAIGILVKVFFYSSSPSSTSSDGTTTSFNTSRTHQIRSIGWLQRPRRALDVQKDTFLQARIGRDRDQRHRDLFEDIIRNGVKNYWDSFLGPSITSRETSNRDAQHVLSAIDQLLTLNGWVAAACPTLLRPFGQNKHENAYDDLIRQNHLYYIAIIVHSADHFLVDQLAVIVQMARRLGTQNIFVSMLDYDSTDSTETLIDLCEAVLTLLGVSFRINRVPPMTTDPKAAYYPLEEAHMKNLALQPLRELYEKRRIGFKRVIWLKGFTCPNDIFETIKISFSNDAAMVCGMDWAQHNGFFIFSDRWRTRDIEGDQFRQSKSTAANKGGGEGAVPPRDRLGAARYSEHLPFQVFCCEAGTHIVDPEQSYYKGVLYRAGTDFHNASEPNTPKRTRASDAPCLDSSQAWFCRDLWIRTAKDSMDELDLANEIPGLKIKRHDQGVWSTELRKREVVDHPYPDDEEEEEEERETVQFERRQPAGGPAAAVIHPGGVDGHNQPGGANKLKLDEEDANAGSDYDAMSEDEGGDDEVPAPEGNPLPIPNNVFRPARILVNPRCATTYAGVSHTQLARDLFGDDEDEENGGLGVRQYQYVLDDWDGAPESFVCQEQRQTGGRKATKTQRRLRFSLHEELQRL